MTLDTSALIAILFAEPGYLDLVDRILEAGDVRVGAPTITEASLVFAGRKGKASTQALQELIHELGATVVPFGEAEWHAAADAFAAVRRRRFLSHRSPAWLIDHEPPPRARMVGCAAFYLRSC